MNHNSFVYVPADEMVLPAADADFVFDGLSAMPPTWTYSRVGAALGRGPDGRWTSYAENVQRPYYDPISLENRGLILEPSRTQMIYSSRPTNLSLVQASYVDDATVMTPFGLGGRKLTPNASNTVHGANLSFGSTQATSLPSTAPTISFHFVFKPIGVLNRGIITCQIRSGASRSVEFSALDGGLILSSNMLSAQISPDTDGFYRLEFSLNYGTGSSTATSNFEFRTDAGGSTFSGDGTSGFIIAYYGAESGTEVTSPIISSGTSVSRSEDVLQAQPGWLHSGGKTVGIQYTPTSNANQVIFSASGADTIELSTTPSTVSYGLSTAGDNIGNISGLAPPPWTERTNVFTAAFNLFWLTQNGVKIGVDEEGFPPNDITSVRIGARSSGGGLAGSMFLKRIKAWAQDLDREVAAAFSGDLSIVGIIPVLPEINLQATRSIPPSETTIAMTVTLVGETANSPTVNYRTINGTATAGADYISTSGTLVFPPGENIAFINIPLGTRSLTQHRTFTLELSSPLSATIGNPTCVITLLKANPTAHEALKSVTFNGPLSADWSLTRSTPGYARDSDGVWKQVAAGQPRIHYMASDDVGILIEPASEQRLFDSVVNFYVTNSSQSTDTTTVTPTGTRSIVWRENTTTAGHLLRASWGPSSSDWPTGDLVVWMILKVVGPRTRYRFSVKGIDNVWTQVQFQITGAGSVAVTPPANVTGLIEPEPMWPGWYRVGLSRTQAVTAGVNPEFDISPIDDSNNNGITGDASYGLNVCHIQVEPGLIWTSPILATAAGVKTVRAMDILKAAGTWHNRNAFALGLKFKRFSVPPQSQRIVQFRDAPTAVDDFGILTVDGTIRAPLTTNGTFHANINGPVNTLKTYSTALLSIDNARYAMWVGGTLAGEISMAGKTLPKLTSVIRFGSKEQDGSQAAPIVIQALAYWSIGMTNEEGIVFSTDLFGVPPGEEEPEGPAIVSIPTSLTVIEGQSVNVPITKSGVGACSVTFRTKAQTASYNVDYTGVGPDVISFAENESNKSVTVNTLADSENESPDETFAITIESPVDCTLGNANGTVTIIPDPDEPEEPPPTGEFPRAHGFATHVNCGEGKSWFKVTSLNNSGTGTLRDALSSGNRHIIFEVGGTIKLTSHISVEDDNITVSGETAPYPGIIIQGNADPSGGEVNSKASNHRFSHLTFEKGWTKDTDNGDCIKISPGSSSSTWTRSNVHYSHCLFLWSQDEMIEIWPSSGGKISNISITDCILAEALWKPQDEGYAAHVKVSGKPYQNQHNYGLICGYRTKKLDVQYTVFADMDMRFPFIDHSTSVVLANVICSNTTKGATIQHNKEPAPKEKMLVTCKGYLSISGPQSTTHTPFHFHSYNEPMYDGTRVHVSSLYGWKGSNSSWITPGNSVFYRFDKPYCNESSGKVNVEVSSPPIDIPDHSVSALTAQQIYDRALANCGPWPKNRSNHSVRVINKLKNKSGSWVNHESVSKVGGKTPSTSKSRKLDGTTKFDDGTTIPAPPTSSDITAVKNWLELFRSRIQYD